MFPLVSRLWNGLNTIAPCLLPRNGHFVVVRSLISSRSQRAAVDLVRLYHEVHLNEDDMEENFIRGWGPGGQKVNKSNNCVQLIHKPTGIVIKLIGILAYTIYSTLQFVIKLKMTEVSVECHESRSLARNRAIARELLKQKLDFLYNGKESAVGKAIAKIKKRKASYARKRRKREQAVTTGLQNVDEGPSDSVEDDDKKPSAGS